MMDVLTYEPVSLNHGVTCESRRGVIVRHYEGVERYSW